MAIRPIDLQLMVHKAADVSKLEQGEGRRPESANQQFSQIIQKQTEEEAHQVLQLNKSEQDPIDKDGSGKNSRERKRKDKGKQDDKQRQTQTRSNSTSMFDVTV